MLAAGPEAIARHRDFRETFAQGPQAWHQARRADHPHWPAVGPLAFEAATGVVYELSSARVATGRVAELPALKDEFVALQLALLRILHA